MKNFSVSNYVMGMDSVNIGISPGKFDTKQLILSSIAVLFFSAIQKNVHFVRTLEREELSKCQMFINDDFTTIFPVIPSYNDVEKQWKENSSQILSAFHIYDEESISFVSGAVGEKICNLESIDCLMDLYSIQTNMYIDSFDEALKITLKLIKKEIKDAIDEKIYFHTIKLFVENANDNYFESNIYVQGWRHIIKNINNGTNISYAVFPDEDGTLLIESFDKNIIMKKYVKGMPGVSYSGRFFIKVRDIDVAKNVIQKLPKRSIDKSEKYA